MTLYSTFFTNAVSSFENMFKNYLASEENFQQDSIVEIIYRPIYSPTDSDSVITLKFNRINSIINSILTDYHEDLVDHKSLLHFKNDVDVIMVFKTITIKFFNLTKILSKRQNELYDILLLNECPNLETIYRAFPVEDSDLYFVVSKTIDTSFKNSKETILSASQFIRENTLNALRYLSFHGWNHRDVSIDNLGLNTETNNFVLFDFGSAKNTFDQEQHDQIFMMDIISLNKSILFHTED